MDIKTYWRAVLAQDAGEMAAYFWEDARIFWHNTNECFTVPEFIRANCTYPGQWDGKLERLTQAGDTVITVTHVYTKNRELSFHAVSFLTLREDKIARLDEYWGDDGEAPQWRQAMGIGQNIKPEDREEP